MRRALCLTGAFLLLAAGLLSLLGDRYWRRPFACGGKNNWIAQAKCKEYHDDAQVWRVVLGRLPERLEEMEAPLRPGEPPLADIVEDPWGNPYVLNRKRDDICIRSLGPDRRAGTEDDIVYPEVRSRTGQ
jgi:hypothetical protein